MKRKKNKNTQTSRKKGKALKKEKKQDIKMSRTRKGYCDDYYPFTYIEDNLVHMENTTYRFFEIIPFSINLHSKEEMDQIVEHLQVAYDGFTNALPFVLHIQNADSGLEQHINYYEEMLQNDLNDFQRRVISEQLEYLNKKSNDPTLLSKKNYYVRFNNSDSTDVIQEIDAFKDRLEEIGFMIADVSKSKIKQLLTQFSLNKHIDFPDSELELISEDMYMATKKKKKKKSYDREIPDVLEFKDFLVPFNISFHSDCIRNGDLYAKVLGLQSIALKRESKHLPVLEEVCSLSNVTTTIYFEPLELKKYKKVIDNTTKNNVTNIGSETDVIDVNSEKDVLNASYKNAVDDGQLVFYISTYFMITSKSMKELTELETALKTKANMAGVNLESLRLQKKKGFQSVNPLGRNYLRSLLCQNWTTESISALFPFNNCGLNDAEGGHLGVELKRKNSNKSSDIDNLGDFFLDIFTSNDNRTNFNVAINGNSGMGKTTLVMLLMVLCNLKGYTILSTDIKRDYVKLFEALGGINISLSGANEYCINPLQSFNLTGEPSDLANAISEAKYWARIYKKNWKEELLDYFEYFFTEALRVKNFYNIDLRTKEHSDWPILSDIVKEIDNEIQNINSSMPKDKLNTLKAGLLSATEGADTMLFNRHTNLGNIENQKAINFDVFDLTGGDITRRTAVIYKVTSFMASKVYAQEELLRNNKVMDHIVLFFDEVHDLIKEHFKAVIEAIQSLLRKDRMFLGSVVTATQTVNEVFDVSATLKADTKPLFTLPTYKFYFNPGEVKKDEYQDLLNLTDAELAKVLNLKQGQCLVKYGNVKKGIKIDFPKWFKDVKVDAELKKVGARI